jgi:nucleoside-diphosphate-sugar epimerase
LGRKRAPLLTRHGLSVFLRPTAFSYEKAQSELGWAPKVKAREGLERTLEWLKSDEAQRLIASRGR